MLLTAVFGALLWGCAPLAPISPAESPAERAWQERRASLLKHDVWALTGRLAIQTPEENWHATVRWEQRNDAYSIAIFGPLGQGAVRVSGRPGSVVLERADGSRSEAADPDTLLADALGQRLPVSGLRYWLLGIDDPRYPGSGRLLDDDGRLQALTQQDWDLRFERYQRHRDLELPALLQAVRPDLRVRAVITRWDDAPP